MFGFSVDVYASSSSVAGTARARAGQKNSSADARTAAMRKPHLHLNKIALLLAARAARYRKISV